MTRSKHSPSKEMRLLFPTRTIFSAPKRAARDPTDALNHSSPYLDDSSTLRHSEENSTNRNNQKMSSMKPNRRAREKQRHRREILESACDVFAEKGFRKTTIQDISHVSEFSVASIYKHFESKEDIYHSLIEDVLGIYYNTLKRKTSGVESPLEQLLIALDITTQMIVERVNFCRFLLREFRPNLYATKDSIPEKSADVYWKLINFFVDIFERGIEKKELVDLPPFYLTISLLGNVFSFTSYWVNTSKGDLSLGEDQQHIIPRVFFNAVATKPLPARFVPNA